MVEKSINKDRLIKNFWTLVTKQDVNGIQVFLTKYRSYISNDIRFPPMLHCTALHVAAQKNNEQMAMLFLNEGVDINAQNKIGATALHLAARLGHVQMVSLLLHEGADYSIVDEQMHCPFEVAMWCVVESALLYPLRSNLAALEACEDHANRDHQQLHTNLNRISHDMERLIMEWEDMQSQALEEWMAYLQQTSLESQLQVELTQLKQTLEQCEIEKREQATHQMNLREELESVFARYRTALSVSQEASVELQNQLNALESVRHTKDLLSTTHADKLGILDTMVQHVNDIDIQIWGISGLVHLTQDVNNSEPHEILLKQSVLQVIHDTIERFPYHAKIQEYAMTTTANLCDAFPGACELCMQERFIDNFQLARTRFDNNEALLGQCIVALRAIMMPSQPCEVLSQVQIKFTGKFCTDDNSFVVDMLAKALNSNIIALQDLVPDLAGLLFVLAKYNARQVFLECDNLGLRTVLAFLVRDNIREEVVHMKCPEQDTLPSCYISFGLSKVILLIQKYASNPDVIMWGIRFLRNLAERDVMAKEQVNRSGIELILAQLITACKSTTLRVSILQLLYVAFLSSEFNEVEELSTMVLNCIRDCVLEHQNSLSMQEWALKNFVIASQHPSNLEFLMQSQESVQVCVINEILFPYTEVPIDEYDDRKSNPVIIWAVRSLLLLYQYRKSFAFIAYDKSTVDGIGGDLHNRANCAGTCQIIIALENHCKRSHDPTTAPILNMLIVLRKYIGCSCTAENI
ncbi:hypothetical protein THRCLA_03661 [Thraustotheca clavata]|uniref:Uncharacterized protein n=1 Tax=Thraustotheca clavata TaxID=74557 RepID=A0A1W0A1B9_9STRA|nr:hypothetical protein THRCLA_03661 [Thraustotheca clavata]